MEFAASICSVEVRLLAAVLERSIYALPVFEELRAEIILSIHSVHYSYVPTEDTLILVLPLRRCSANHCVK